MPAPFPSLVKLQFWLQLHWSMPTMVIMLLCTLHGRNRRLLHQQSRDVSPSHQSHEDCHVIVSTSTHSLSHQLLAVLVSLFLLSISKQDSQVFPSHFRAIKLKIAFLNFVSCIFKHNEAGRVKLTLPASEKNGQKLHTQEVNKDDERR